MCSPNPASTFGFSSRPFSSISSAPASSSSAGWNISFTLPFSSPAVSASSRAAVSSIAVWVSCPQEWQCPFSAAKGSPDSSAIGSASMSPRSSRQGPSPLPITQVIPALPQRTGVSPSSRSRAST